MSCEKEKKEFNGGQPSLSKGNRATQRAAEQLPLAEQPSERCLRVHTGYERVSPPQTSR